MDAAQKLIKNSALLLISALVFGAPAWCASVPTLVVPSTVTVTSTGFTNQQATSSDGTTHIPYVIGTPNYGTGPSNWLSVTGDNTTPGNINFQVSGSAGLTACSTATVTFTPQQGQGNITTTWSLTPQTVTVTWAGSGTCSGGGGGSTTLTASPTSLSLTNTTNSGTVAITTTSSTAITINANATATTPANGTWLQAQLSSGSVTSTSGATLRLQPVPRD
jgi:hypothetical protein